MSNSKLKEELVSKKSNLSDNARVVLAKRYLKKDEKGEAIETPEDMFFRVAENIASAEKFYGSDPDKWTRIFYDMMTSLRFLPNSPTLMNAGRDLQQLSACFVLSVGDSMSEIFDAVKNMALIQKSGGGTGFYFSNLRPARDRVKSTMGVSSGPISFMKVFDATTDTIRQGGTRRGANMAILRCDHPDILEFISAKEKDGVLSNFNISVSLTDEFMKALEKDEEYSLINPRNKEIVRRIKASEVFNKIVDFAWKNGEPGIVFIDEINRHNPTPHIGAIEGTNPCLTGDTLVAVADGRVAVPIKQLAEEEKDVPVYCRDNSGKITIRMMRRPRITGFNSRIIKVTLENGHVLRITEGHKFVLSSGLPVEAKNLKSGDSLSIMTRLVAPFEKVLKHGNSKPQDYYWINGTNQKKWVLDHQLIYNFYDRDFGFNDVVYHKDRNPLNNSIDNLDSMPKKAHDYLHREDKNPRRRAQTKWSKEKWEEYHDNMSAAVSGTLNGRFSGISNEDLFNRAVELSKEAGRKLSIHEWENFAIKNGYPSQFSEYMTKIFGTISEFLDKAAIEAEVEGAGLKKEQIREFSKFLRLKDISDLDLFFEDNVIKVRKNCEGCGKEFILTYARREVCYCSLECSNKSQRVSEQGMQNRKDAADDIREDQINAFNDLRLKMGRIPMKKEYAVYCKNQGIPFRLPIKREIAQGKLIGTFSNWENFKEEALTYNHRVLSVEQDGFENVYNGTVDEYHNFYVGHFKEEIDGCTKFIYINNLQCGEQPLLDKEACNLGSINISLFVNDDKSIDWNGLKDTVWAAVRFLDNVIDMNKYPLPEIEAMTKSNRKIGLGVMGFSDMLIKMGVAYNSDKAISLAESFMQFIRDEGRKASIDLAKERGPFPNFKGSIYDGGPEIRNATVTTIAPTGTLSMIASCSSGVEPLFGLVYEKNVLDNKKFLEVHPLFLKVVKERGLYSEDMVKALYKAGSIQNMDIPTDIKRIFVTAHDIAPIDHIAIQAVFQKYTDNAVSKTVNFRHDATKKDVEDVYRYAYKMGCKGVTVYRDGSRSGQVLTVGSSESTKGTVSAKDFEKGTIIAKDIKLPETFANGDTRIVKKEGKKFYINFSYLPDDKDKKYPICMWIITNQKYGASELRVCNRAAHNLQKLAQISGINNKFIKETVEKANKDYPHNRLGRMVSLCLRHGVKREDILESLLNIEGDNVSTLLAAVRKFLSKTLEDGTVLKLTKCPDCQSRVKMENGCMTCENTECGWSAC